MAIWVLCQASCHCGPQDGCMCVLCGVDGLNTSLSRGVRGRVRHRFPLGLPLPRGSPRHGGGLWRIRFSLSACFPGLSQGTELSWPCYQCHLSCTQLPQRQTYAKLGLFRLVFGSPALHADPSAHWGTEPTCALGCRTSVGLPGDRLVPFDSVPGRQPPASFHRNGRRNYHAGAPLS